MQGLRSGIGGLLLVFLSLLIPFGLIHLYTRNLVSAALLRRDIHMAGLRKEQLLKKNMALKEALGRLTGKDLVIPTEGLPFSENNRIVRLRLHGDNEAADSGTTRTNLP
ncbi:MAG: hypothetical protein JNM27_09045 [Leptospirales bacterium]|nr:hypothetical protein [Leptospirales bacterium]